NRTDKSIAGATFLPRQHCPAPGPHRKEPPMDLHPYYPLLRQTSLLRGMRDDELDLLLRCFAPRVRRYQKGELLLLAGYETREVGILLEGKILALKNTPDGSSVAITQMGPGGLFGDVLSGSSVRSPVSVMAQAPCLA